MGIKCGSVLPPWRPAFWNVAEVVVRTNSAAILLAQCTAWLRGKRPLDLPFGVVARLVCPLPLHLSPYAQEY